MSCKALKIFCKSGLHSTHSCEIAVESGKWGALVDRELSLRENPSNVGRSWL